MDAKATPLATAEFLVVDVETTGRAGDLCELTEVGAVLVGGGELHEEVESLVRVERPLSRGIERFTGITQAMVDDAPPPAEVLPRFAALLDGRALVAHSAQFDKRALRQAFERCDLRWPDPPVLCTVAMARRFAPLVGQRKLARLAESLGIEVEGVHRALVDARTCARIFCALFPRLCASAGTLAEATALLGPRRRPKSDARRPGRRRPPADRPADLKKLPRDPGVYIFRDERGKPLYVGKSISLRTRARAHFCAPAGWTERAAVVDYRSTNSELGALVLENRLIKQLRPPGNVKLKRTDGHVYLRCRLDIPYPVLEVADEPAPGHAVNIGPLRGRGLAEELAGQLGSLYGLRQCGRRLRLREHPSIYGQMGRCMSPCLNDLDPNAYRRKLDEALGLFDGSGPAGERLLHDLEVRMRAASAEQRYESAAALRRRHERLAALLGRLSGVLEATHAATRLVLAQHPAQPRWDAFWIVAGRVVDWGPLPEPHALERRTGAALERRPGPLRPEEVDEVRIVAGWTAAHLPEELPLTGGDHDVRGFAAAATGAAEPAAAAAG
ncbi:MAG: polymerase subunit epsilon [Thermoleophilaceae bacterium]|nr:polymerase subunit epsilon [Thermoleophilaceae bacterium]